jgi:hypothetical protein
VRRQLSALSTWDLGIGIGDRFEAFQEGSKLFEGGMRLTDEAA